MDALMSQGSRSTPDGVDHSSDAEWLVDARRLLKETTPRTQDLDPSDWDAFDALAHKMVDEMGEWLRTRVSRDEPTWRPVPSGMPGPPVPDGVPAERIYEDFKTHVLSYVLGNTHPGFFGWVHGGGTPVGALAEFLAGCVNANVGGRDQAPIHLERQVVAWCRDLFEFPQEAGGILVSGTSMANLLGVAVARHWATRGAVRAAGLVGGPELVGYGSVDAHNSVVKAFELLGLGSTALRAVPVDENGAMSVPALNEAIEADRERGSVPFVVLASAGTIDRGAIDPITALREVCDRADLWLHVDGAFGALAILSSKIAPRLEGIQKADSLAFDFHKWAQVPYDAGCVLVRDGSIQRAAFGNRPNYLETLEGSASGGVDWPCDFGLELSRGFRALKIWFTLRYAGWDRIGAVVDRSCRNASYFSDRVDAEEALELVVPATLHIVCFRHRVPGATQQEEDDFNLRLLREVQRSGVAVPSHTRIDGRIVIRVCVGNHRTRKEDLDALLESVLAIGAGMLA